jgi:hypothetical protein
VKDNVDHTIGMSKEKFDQVQVEGDSIFTSIGENISKGFDSPEIQEQMGKWRKWLDNFSTYSDDAVLELGRAYSKDPRFTKVFGGINEDLPEFLTKAIEYYCANKK